MKKSLLDAALILAQESLPRHSNYHTGTFLHWAFIIQDNKIIGWSTNDFGEPPKGLGYKCKRDTHLFSTRHAEYKALMKCKGIMNFQKNWEIINIRLNKQGDMRISKPCNRCYSLTKDWGCVKYYFTTEVGWAKMV